MKKILIIIILILAAALRLWRLDNVPVSLFGDEVDIGYHSYSLLKTGRDYMGDFLPLHLRSLADVKTPLYAYSIIPTIAIFGISPWGVRLPAAIFGVLGIYLFYLLIELVFKNKHLALLTAFLLAVSPWDMQYSRWGFEGTEMLALYLAGLYFFLRALNSNKKGFVLSAIFFGLTPMAYHAAEVFLPLSLITLVGIYRKEIINIPRRKLILPVFIFLLITVPYFLSTFFTGGLDRFQATSIFKNPTIEGQLGAVRLRDQKMGYENISHLFHNKVTFYGSILVNNYLEPFSTEFLFIKGDPEPTHTVAGRGEFYKFEAIFLLIGLIFFFLKIQDKKTKLMFSSWILLSPVASILTTGGGYHASRLLFLLPPLTLLISLGIYYSYGLFHKKIKVIYVVVLSVALFLSFIFYQHDYWKHYPWDSQNWWHAGFKEAIQSTVLESKNYDKIIISGADEPPLIFFLGWSEYPPLKFQQQYPLAEVNLEGFGKVSRLDKYYFPSIGQGRGLYELGSILPDKTLYLATAKEIKLDLIKEPLRVPSDLILIKSITYPSGDPIFYLFTKNEKSKKQ